MKKYCRVKDKPHTEVCGYDADVCDQPTNYFGEGCAVFLTQREAAYFRSSDV